MQDLSRGDLSNPNEGESYSNYADKNINSSIISKNDLNLSKHMNAEENANFNASNVNDLFPSHTTTWQQHPMNTNRDLGQYRLSIRSHNRFEPNNTKLLLQGSDDPLISHGANSMLSHDDEHPADFAKSLMASYSNQHHIHTATQEGLSMTNGASLAQQQQQQQTQQDLNHQQRPKKSGCSNLTKQQLKVKANLMSARNHKQNRITTPPPSGNQKQQQNNLKTKKKSDNGVKLKFHHQALPPEYLSQFEATQDQVRTFKVQPNVATTQQRNSNKTTTTSSTSNPHKQSQPRNSHENVRSWLQKIAEIQRTANAAKEEINLQQQQQQQQQQKTNETQKISNNLILDSNNNHHHQPQQQHHHHHHHNPQMQNLPYMGKITLDNCKSRRGRKPKKADICHMIYKNYGTILHTKSAPPPQTQDSSNGTFGMKTHITKTDMIDEQPLNLCLRDQPTDSYSISSGDEVTESNSSCPTPLTTTSDTIRDIMLANSLKNSLGNSNELQQNEKLQGQILKSPVPSSNVNTNSANEDNMLHPITMYYQKLLQSGVLLSNINGPFETIQKDNQLALKIPLPSGFFSPQKMMKTTSNTVPANLENTETAAFLIKSENSTNQQDVTHVVKQR